jgi:hypothetical protein
LKPDDLNDKIEAWRTAARQHARDALNYDREGDTKTAAYYATWATLYYVVALDAAHFGSQPEIDEEEISRSG